MIGVDDTTLSGHIQELRRGTVVLACLSELRAPRYGYDLLTTLGEDGFTVDANTLYPLLRRLEKQQLLRSEWNTDEARPRKFYVVTDTGLEMLERLGEEWTELDRRLRRVLRRELP